MGESEAAREEERGTRRQKTRFNITQRRTGRGDRGSLSCLTRGCRVTLVLFRFNASDKLLSNV